MTEIELINIVVNNVLNRIKAEITDKSYLSYDDNPRRIIDESWVLEIIDEYKTVCTKQKVRINENI